MRVCLGLRAADSSTILPRIEWKLEEPGGVLRKMAPGEPPQLRADRRFACVVAGYWVSGFSSSNLVGTPPNLLNFPIVWRLVDLRCPAIC